LDIQVQRLTESGCDKTFSEKFTGKTGSQREQLEAALNYIREGDIFVVTKLDRLARSVIDLANIAKLLEEKNVDLVVLDQQIDTTTPSGRLLFYMISAIGEFERDMIMQRTAEGRAVAKARGVKFGRKSMLEEMTTAQRKQLVREFEQGDFSKEDLAIKYKVSRATIYRFASKIKMGQGVSCS
jgi:DNA invertase Pin-like site-specific DNA recombinase